MKSKRQLFYLFCYGAWAQKESVKLQNMRACTGKTGLSSMKLVWLMIGRSKELEDVGRVASSFQAYLGKIEATLLAGYLSLKHLLAFNGVINTCWYTCTFNILSRCAKGLSWNHGKEETLFMSVSSSYSVIYLDIFAGLVGLICRFFCVIASLFIASRIKKRELVSNRAAIAAILM